MLKLERSIAGVLFFICLFFGPVLSAEEEVRILFVGNSYTFYNNLPGIVEALYEGAGFGEMTTGIYARGGMALFHVAGELRHEFIEVLERGWDIVVLQEQSTLGGRGSVKGKPVIGDPQRFHEAARVLHREISRRGAKTALLLTWAREYAPETQPALTAAYSSIAQELQAALIPAGPAWQVARREKIDGLYSPDKSHPSPKGSYLAAWVVIAKLFGEVPTRTSHSISVPGVIHSQSAAVRIGGRSLRIEIAEHTARKMREIAWDTVATSVK